MNSKIVTTLALALASLGLGNGPRAAHAQPAPETLLRVTDSNRELERRIGDYFEHAKGWKIDYDIFKGDETDLLLRIGFDCGAAVPSIRFAIDSEASARSSDGTQVVETRINVIALFRYEIGPKDPRRAKVLEALNAFHNQYWVPQRCYLDKDGDLALQSSINIPGDEYGVHPELVADAVQGMVSAWKKLHAELGERGLPQPTSF